MGEYRKCCHCVEGIAIDFCWDECEDEIGYTRALL